MFEDNNFVCMGKVTGFYNRRATPGGLLLQDLVVAVTTKTPWKQKKVMHLQVTLWDDLIQKSQGLRTGDKVRVTGFIEQSGTMDKKEFKLIATQIEKEK